MFLMPELEQGTEERRGLSLGPRRSSGEPSISCGSRYLVCLITWRKMWLDGDEAVCMGEESRFQAEAGVNLSAALEEMKRSCGGRGGGWESRQTDSRNRACQGGPCWCLRRAGGQGHPLLWGTVQRWDCPAGTGHPDEGLGLGPETSRCGGSSRHEGDPLLNVSSTHGLRSQGTGHRPSRGHF